MLAHTLYIIRHSLSGVVRRLPLWGVLTLVGVLLGVITAIAAVIPWPQFQGGAGHTGLLGLQSNALVPTANNLLWHYRTGGAVRSAAAVVSSADLKVATNAPVSRLAKAANIGDTTLLVKKPNGFTANNTYYLGSTPVLVTDVDKPSKTLTLSKALSTGFKRNIGIYNNPPVNGANGMAFIGSDDGTLYDFDPVTGELLWSSNAGHYLGAVRGTPAVDINNLHVYVASLPGRIFAFSVNGSLLWAYPKTTDAPLGEICGSPVVDDATDNIYFAAQGQGTGDKSAVYELSPSGALIASHEFDSAAEVTTGISLYQSNSGVRVLAGTKDTSNNTGKLYSFDSGLASLLEVTTGPISTIPVVDTDQYIYVGSEDGTMSAYKETVVNGNAALGTVWTLSLGSAITVSASLRDDIDITQRVLYVGNATQLHAITMSGTGMAVIPTDNTIAIPGKLTAPVGIDSDGKILLSTAVGTIAAYAADHTAAWSWNSKTNGGMSQALPIRTSPALAIIDATIANYLTIVGGDDGMIYAIGGDPSDTPTTVDTDDKAVNTSSGYWPFFHNDARRQGSLSDSVNALEPGPWQPTLRWWAQPGDALKVAGETTYKPLSSSPVVTTRTKDGRARVYIASEDGRLCAYDASTGQDNSGVTNPLWKWPTNTPSAVGPIHGTPAVNVNGTIAFTAMDGKAYFVGQDGVQLHTTGLGTAGQESNATASPVFSTNGDTLYVATQEKLIATVSDTDLVSPDTIEKLFVPATPIRRVCIYTSGAGVLNFYRKSTDDDEDDAVYSQQFDAADHARYIEVPVNFDAGKVEWKSFAQAGEDVTMNIYGLGTSTVDHLAYAAMSHEVADLGGVKFVNQLTVASEQPFKLSIVDANDVTTVWGTYAKATTDSPLMITIGYPVKQFIFDKVGTETAGDLTVDYTTTTSGGGLFAIDTASGAVKDSDATLDPIVSSPLAVPTTTNGVEMIYVATLSGKVLGYQYNSTTGVLAQVWAMQFAAPFYASPVLDSDGTALVIPDYTGTIHIINLASHTETGKISVFGTCSNSLAVTRNNIAYLVNDYGLVYTVNLADPLQKAILVNALLTYVHSSPVIDSTGCIYFGSDYGAVYCLAPGGTIINWSYRPDRAVITSSLIDGVTAGTKTLYVSSISGFRVNDDVYIAHADGTAEEKLGTITQVVGEIRTKLTQKVPEAQADILHVTSTAGIHVNDSIYLVKPLDDVVPDNEYYVGKVKAIQNATTIQLDKAVTMSYDVDSKVIASNGQGWITVTTGPKEDRFAGDILRVYRGIMMPIRTSPAIGPSQTVYVGANDGILYAIGPMGPAGAPSTLPDFPDQQTASPWWTFHHDRQRTGYSPYPGPRTNSLRWYRDTGGTLDSSPALGYADGSARLGVLYVASSDDSQTGTLEQNGALVSYNASNGNLRWRFTDNGNLGKVYSSPAVFTYNRAGVSGNAGNDEYIVFGTEDMPKYTSTTLAISISKGYTFDSTHGVIVSNPLSFVPGMQVVIKDAGSDNNLETVGTVKSVSYLNSVIYLSPRNYSALHTHAAGSQVIGQTSQQGHVYCVNRSGKLQWKFPSDDTSIANRIGAVNSSPVVDEEGIIYFGTNDGVIYALYPYGTEKWHYVVEPQISGDKTLQIESSPALDDQGRLFVGVSEPDANHGYLVALDTQAENDADRELWILTKNTSGNYFYPFTASPMITTVNGQERLFIGEENLTYDDRVTDPADPGNDTYFYSFAPDDIDLGATTDANLIQKSVGVFGIHSTAAAVPDNSGTTVTKVSGGDTLTVVSNDGFAKDMPVIIYSSGKTVTATVSETTDTENADGSHTYEIKVAFTGTDKMPDDPTSIAPNRACDRAVFVGTIDGNMWAFTNDTLTEMWKSPDCGPIRTSPAISTEVGTVGSVDNLRSYTVYFGANNHVLYAYTFYKNTIAEAGNVTLRWARDLRDRLFSSPVIGMKTNDSGRAILYQASRDNYIYAFGDNTGYDGDPMNPDGPGGPYQPSEDGDQHVPSTVAVTKTAERDKTDPNLWKFTITVRNAGRGVVENLKIYDFIPDTLATSEPPTVVPDPSGKYVARVSRQTDFTSAAGGKNDLLSYGTYTGNTDRIFTINIVHQPMQPEAFSWSTNDGLNGGPTTIVPNNEYTLANGVIVKFMGASHYAGEQWTFNVYTRYTDPADDYLNKENWQIVWSKGGDATAPDGFDDNGFSLEPDKKDPKLQPDKSVYQQQFVFTMHVKEPKNPYNSKDTCPQLKFDPDDTKTQYDLGDQFQVKLFGHPIGDAEGGLNKLLAVGKCYKNATELQDITAYKETPVQNDWTSDFVVRLYYNGYEIGSNFVMEGPDPTNNGLPKDLSAAILHPFSVWNQINNENGEPLHFVPQYTRKGTQPNSATIKQADSTFAIPLVPFMPSLMQQRNGRIGNVIPYAWRVTIQQAKARINQRIISWGNETAMNGRYDDTGAASFARDFLIKNPIGVKDGSNADLTAIDLGSKPPKQTATSPLRITNVSNWTPLSTGPGQRFMLSPIDLSNSTLWTSSALQSSLMYDAIGKPLPFWGGFQYDPYLENHLLIGDQQLSNTTGVSLAPNGQLPLTISRTIPTHQPAGATYKTLLLSNTDVGNIITSLGFTCEGGAASWTPGKVIYYDKDNNGKYSFGDPCLAPSMFDTRVFTDLNSNGTWDAGEPYFVLGSPTVAGQTPGLLSTTAGVNNDAGTVTNDTKGISLGKYSLGTLSLPSFDTLLRSNGNADASITITAPSQLTRPGMTGSDTSDAQPLTTAVNIPTNLTIPKSPAGSPIDFGRVFSFPITGNSIGRDATGSYTGTIDFGSLHTTLSTRVNESQISMLMSGITRPSGDPRPDFDAGRRNDGSVWTNYLTGVESWPTAAIVRMNATMKDELGIWVASSTPQPQPGWNTIIPQANTDTNIWYRRSKHLVTKPLNIASSGAGITVYVPTNVARQVYCNLTDASYNDLVVLRTLTAPYAYCYGVVTSVNLGGGIINMTTFPANSTWPQLASQTMVEIFSHPWVPVISSAFLENDIRKLMVDKGVVNDAGPKPLRFTTPAMTMDSDGKLGWLAWSVNATILTTREGKRTSTPFSYLQYMRFDPQNPTSNSGANKPHWISPASVEGNPTRDIFNVREKPVFLPSVDAFDHRMVIYEAGTGNTRGLYYAADRGAEIIVPGKTLTVKDTTGFMPNQNVKLLATDGSGNPVTKSTRIIAVLSKTQLNLDDSLAAGYSKYVLYAQPNSDGDGDWSIDNPLSIINQAFSSAGRPQVWADTDSTTDLGESTMKNINIIFQGRRADDNVDLYYARLQTQGYSRVPGDTKAMILKDQAELKTPQSLSSTDGKTFYTSDLAWDKTVKFAVSYSDGTSEQSDQLIISNPDSGQRYAVNAPSCAMNFDPIRGIVTVTTTKTVSKIAIVGTPRLQRLTTHMDPDVNPTVSIERWRYVDTAGTTQFGGGSGLDLKAKPRVWIFWTRQHSDGLGNKVYFRTWRMDTVNAKLNIETPHRTKIMGIAGSTVTIANATGFKNGMPVVLSGAGSMTTATISNIVGTTLTLSIAPTAAYTIIETLESVPERMMPMSLSAQDGSISIGRMSAQAPSLQSPEAGLWVLSTASRSLETPYPDYTKLTPVMSNPYMMHDLFLQVLDEPMPNN